MTEERTKAWEMAKSPRLPEKKSDAVSVTGGGKGKGWERE
jgi:hypothetical protein